jgi:hypothetical protein
MTKKNGIGWPTGKGNGKPAEEASFSTWLTRKNSRLNRGIGIREFESEENEDWHVKVPEWK